MTRLSALEGVNSSSASTNRLAVLNRGLSAWIVRPKKKPTALRLRAFRRKSRLGDLNFVGLKAFLAFHDFEADLLAFFQRLEAAGLDGAEVNEQVFAGLAADKAKAFGVIEPFHRTCLTI